MGQAGTPGHLFRSSGVFAFTRGLLSVGVATALPNHQ